MALRDGDIPIVHSTDDGYPLDDLQAARFMVVIQGEARQNAWTINMPRFSSAYDEDLKRLVYTASTNDGSRVATATLDEWGWEVASDTLPVYSNVGDFEDGWRKQVATELLIAIGIVEPPKGRWARIADRITRRRSA